MELFIFAASIILLLGIQNYRLQMRLNHIQHNIIGVESTETIALFKFLSHVLLEQEIAAMPEEMDIDSERDREYCIALVLEDIAPVAYARYKRMMYP